MTEFDRSAGPATGQELVQAITLTVQAHSSEGGTNGALLANLLRKRYPGLEFPLFGFQRLADAVAEAERQGLVKRDRSVSHLVVLPGPSSEAMPEKASAPSGRHQPFLRPDLWRAFVFVGGSERKFFDRTTGRVVSGPADADPGDNQIEVPRIPSEQQKNWLREFVGSTDGLEAEDAPFDSETWWIDVLAWLRPNPMFDERRWKLERSRRVLEWAKAWARENEIPDRLLFIAPVEQRGRDAGAASGAGRTTCADLIAGDARRRAALLAALGDMPLEELERLSIPARYLLRHFDVK